jgi:hypothetical protein
MVVITKIGICHKNKKEPKMAGIIEGQNKKPKGVFKKLRGFYNSLSSYGKYVGVILIILMIFIDKTCLYIFNKLRDSYNSLSSRRKVYYVIFILLVILTHFIYFLALDFRESYNEEIYLSYVLSIIYLRFIYHIFFKREDSDSVGVFDFVIFLVLFFLLHLNFYVKIDSDYLYNTESDTFIKINNDLHMLSFLELYKGKDAFEEKYIGIKTNFKFEIEIIFDNEVYVSEISVELTPNRVLVDNQTEMSIIYSEIKAEMAHSTYKIFFVDKVNKVPKSTIKDIVERVFSKHFPTLKEDNKLDTLVKNIDIKYFLEKNKKAQD